MPCHCAQLFVPTSLAGLIVDVLQVHFEQNHLPYFVIAGGNLDGFVLKQLRQKHTVLLTHLPLKNYGAITIRNKVVRCRQSEVIPPISSSVPAVLLKLCSQMALKMLNLVLCTHGCCLCWSCVVFRWMGLCIIAQLRIKLSFDCTHIPVGTCLLKGSFLQFHTSAAS